MSSFKRAWSTTGSEFSKRPGDIVHRIKAMDGDRCRTYLEALERAKTMPWWSETLRYLGSSGGMYLWAEGAK